MQAIGELDDDNRTSSRRSNKPTRDNASAFAPQFPKHDIHDLEASTAAQTSKTLIAMSLENFSGLESNVGASVFGPALDPRPSRIPWWAMGEGDLVTVEFLSALKRGALVFDGAMGTELYARGWPFTVCFEWLCCDQPALVADIHHAFRDAGARVLTTNSFGGNGYRLKDHGRVDHVSQINAAAVGLARRHAEDGAFVLGSMGPTGLSRAAFDRDRDAVAQAFTEQGKALWAAGADGLLLETFTRLPELLLALGALRDRLPRAVPVVACVSLDARGVTSEGLSPEVVAAQLGACGADAIGVNCGAGPAPALQALTRMRGPGLPLVAKPNAGMPKRSHGHLSYDVAPAAFGHCAAQFFAAGVAGVGGCCGTTPAHIRAVAAAAAGVRTPVDRSGHSRGARFVRRRFRG